ncbi:CDF family Co(II)/Ni(II) efflux transporter DmeF [Desulforegula conservatrix]|uniref:CDF family Co(II)/Ni(II) efflux transporter DmeF n=1 Tax=Desulforegula conservatrix TaxID=153026 RepID=UPI0003F89FE6|nr:CDF family Co(II)/Ni(II) efflux transporter DmeF [Desulforegula conservatrix]
MNFLEIDEWVHSHDFALPDQSGEKKVKYVIWITAIMMVAEVASGMIFGSMALLADGWHMGTHVLALGVAFFAYAYARKHAKDPAYVFGTGKISVLGGFASAVMLGFAAILICFESVERFFAPEQIRFNEAIIVAVIGLIVNLVSAVILHETHEHNDHSHRDGSKHEGHKHKDHSHGDHDHNLRAAYFHVAADAITSITAIFALSAGKYLGWNWLDPFMGAVGSVVILKWAYGLIITTSEILVDRNTNQGLINEVHKIITSDGETKILDFHMWKINSSEYAAMISISSRKMGPAHFKNMLEQFKAIVHVAVEVNSLKHH